MDRETVGALKKLEQKYNVAAGTSEFTGLLVDINKKHLMSVEDIKKIDAEISKVR